MVRLIGTMLCSLMNFTENCNVLKISNYRFFILFVKFLNIALDFTHVAKMLPKILIPLLGYESLNNGVFHIWNYHRQQHLQKQRKKQYNGKYRIKFIGKGR